MIRLRKWIRAYAYLLGWLLQKHPELIPEIEQLAKEDVSSEVASIAKATALEARIFLELPR